MTVHALKRSLWIAGAALFSVGLFGWWDRMTNGEQHAHYGSIVPWGLWISVYIFFIGLSAGSFLISSMVYVFGMKKFEPVGRLSLLTALVTLGCALLSVWADLGHMFRFWHVFIYPNFQSAMAWMIWLYSTYFLLLAIETWFLLRRDMVVAREKSGWKASVYRVLTFATHNTSDESHRHDRKVVKTLATIGIPVAIMFHGGVGTLFGVVIARSAWNSGLFPILFLLSALVSGGALLTLVAAVFQDGIKRYRETIVALGQLVLAVLLVDVVMQFADILVAGYGGVPVHVAALKLMVSGPYWWVFWIWQIAMGTIIPIVILSSPKRRKANWVAGAAGLVVLGFIGTRLNIVIPSLVAGEIKGLEFAIHSPRVSSAYFPSMMEWLVSMSILGLGILLFGLGEKLLPPDGDVDEEVSPLNPNAQGMSALIPEGGAYVHG